MSLPPFLSAKLFGLKVGAWLLIVLALALLVWGAVEVLDNKDKRMVETATKAGASEAVAEGQRQVIDDVRKANDAEERVNNSSNSERYARCLRNATPSTRPNCERFNPVPDR